MTFGTKDLVTHKPILQHVLSKFNIPSVIAIVNTCEDCLVSKSHKLNFPVSSTTFVAPLCLIHTNVWGPSSIKSCSGYYVVFINNYSRFCWTFPLHAMSEVYDCFVQFHKLVKRQFSCKLQVLRSDNGTKFVNHRFKTYCSFVGIIHQTSCPYTPE